MTLRYIVASTEHVRPPKEAQLVPSGLLHAQGQIRGPHGWITANQAACGADTPPWLWEELEWTGAELTRTIDMNNVRTDPEYRAARGWADDEHVALPDDHSRPVQAIACPVCVDVMRPENVARRHVDLVEVRPA